MGDSLLIRELLEKAGRAPSRREALGHLDHGLQIIREWMKRDRDSSHALELEAITRSMRARESADQLEAEREWNKAVSAGKRCASTPEGALTLALIVKDASQRQSRRLSDQERNTLLALALTALNEKFPHGDIDLEPRFLASRSAILRHKAALAGGPQRKKFLEEAEGASIRALHLNSESEPALLQAALTQMEIFRSTRDETEFRRRLAQIHDLLIRACKGDDLVCLLAASRMYRILEDPESACRTFRRCVEVHGRSRRIWFSAYLYGETAMRLYFNQYDEKIVREHLGGARQAVEGAIRAGVSDARTFLALAYLDEAEGKTAASASNLSNIFNDDSSVDWNRVVEFAREDSTVNLAEKGFALGFDTGYVWSRLGTFVWQFRGDLERAEMFYEQSLRLEPKNQIALTNLARILVHRGGYDDLKRAGALLSKVGGIDRNFRWKRYVQQELEAKQARPLVGSGAENGQDTVLDSHRKIRLEFSQTELMSDASKKGKRFERLVFAHCKLCFPNALHDVSVERAGTSDQRDISFKLGDLTFIIETKFINGKADAEEIDQCARQLRYANDIVLLMCMGGFGKAAEEYSVIGNAGKKILLMGPQEIKWLLTNVTDLEHVLLRKLNALEIRGQSHVVIYPNSPDGMYMPG